MTKIKDDFANEAILALGYLEASSLPTVLALMGEMQGYEGPKAVATRYRKSGDQLSAEEKRALGIRSNAFMSYQALEELTSLGRNCPLDAHQRTVWRAVMSATRYASIKRGQEIGADHFIYNIADSSCPGCVRLKGHHFSHDELNPFPPADCYRGDCPMLITPQVDFIGRYVEKVRGRMLSLQITVTDFHKIEGQESHWFNFAFECLKCGSNDLHIPTDDNGDVYCKSCGTAFGPLFAVKSEAKKIGEKHLDRSH